tara:strand:- start:292 stop:504 length:213 start_codon:yes stop_codon:yes gene_type:complete
MSQHLIKEVQLLKHEVKMLKEGPGVRDAGVEIDDIKIRLDAIEAHLNIPAKVKIQQYGHPGVEEWAADQS